MPKLRGDNVQIGVATEGTRNTFESPADFIPGRSPAGVTIQTEKTPIEEARGTGVNSQGSELVRKWAEGDLEFNVRAETIGYILYSLMGTVNSTEDGSTGTYDHTFQINASSPLFQTLSLALANENSNYQDYGYVGAVVSSLELETPADDVVQATVSPFVAQDETTQNDFSPAYADTDALFNHTDVTIEMASDVGSLSGNSQTLKEFSLSIDNNSDGNNQMGDENPEEILAGLVEISGSLTADYENEDLHNDYAQNNSLALRVTMERSDLSLASGDSPRLRFTMPHITFEDYDQDRSLEDVVTEGIDFQAHYDSTEAYAIEAELRNDVASY